MLVPLDELTALYHRRAAVTHLVAEPMPEILAALTGAPASAAALLDRLAVTFGLAVTPESLGTLQARLDELEAIGLVWRV